MARRVTSISLSLRVLQPWQTRLRGVAWVLGFLALACENGPPPPKPPSERARTGKISDARAIPTGGELEKPPRISPETERAIAQLRNSTIRFTPQETKERKLEFFGNRIARLTRKAIYVADVTTTSDVNVLSAKRTEVPGAREIARLYDNSLLVIGANGTWQLPPDDHAPKPLGKVAYFPGMRLWPELRWPNAFATLLPNHGVFSLYRWDDSEKDAKTQARDGVFLPKVELGIDALSDAVCCQLGDGSYACINQGILSHGWPGLPPKALGPIHAGADVVRLLPGARNDIVRVLRSDGRLEDYFVVPTPKRTNNIVLPWAPFEVTSRGNLVFVLRLLQTASTEPRFELTRVNSRGHVDFATQLETVEYTQATTAFDQQILACPALAVHPRRAWVAVSTCDRIRIFDSETGQELAQVTDVPY